MSDGAPTNAMTEIALALAMGFFSVMVLAIVSMGAGSTRDPAPAAGMHDTAAGMPVGSTLSRSKETVGSAKRQAVDPDTLLIFFGGRFLDAQLQPVDPARFAGTRNRLVLAVSPTLSFEGVAATRRKVPSENVIVVPLDDRGSRILKEKQHEKP